VRAAEGDGACFDGEGSLVVDGAAECAGGVTVGGGSAERGVGDHLDEEEGRKSLFGGLAASGWHVGSVCMKLLVADGQRLAKEAAARGEKIVAGGPSPGFRELRWIRPVLAGDTISFSSVIETKRTSEKRPEWGIMQARNTGTNQRGEPVYSFLATAFVPRRNAGA